MYECEGTQVGKPPEECRAGAPKDPRSASVLPINSFQLNRSTMAPLLTLCQL